MSEEKLELDFSEFLRKRDEAVARIIADVFKQEDPAHSYPYIWILEEIVPALYEKGLIIKINHERT